VKKTAAKPSGTTPLMTQYQSIKSQHGDKVLLFHLGDFYEMFGDDAKTASRVLGITLTSRSKGDGAMPLAGFPVHAAKDYIEKFLAAGHKVAICDQVEDPAKAKGIVKREVTRVITPGTLLDEGLLRSGENNFLAALSPRGERVGLAYVDLSTGEFSVAELDRAELADELSRIRPAEMLVPEGMVREGPGAYGLDDGATGGESLRATAYPDWAFDVQTAHRRMLDHFKVETLDGLGCEDLAQAQSAAGALLRYLEETHRAGLDHIGDLQVLDRREYLAFDGEALRNLEILETIRDGRTEGSLLGVLDCTCTAPGARRLRQWIVRPLADVESIVQRQDAVAELERDHRMRSTLRDALSEVQDLERLASKLAAGRVNGRDLLGLAASFETLPALAGALGESSAAVLTELAAQLVEASSLIALAEKIRATLGESPPVAIKEGGLIAAGVSEELDRLRQVRSGGKTWIAAFQASEAKRTGISSLKVGYNKVFGYYIEVTRANLAGIPEGYERKQTLVNAERFITPELKEREAEVLGAEERIVAMEYDLFCALRDEVAAHLGRIRATGARVGDVDALAAFAEVASRRGYVRPLVDDSLVLEVVEGRHPVLEATMDSGRYVPNDLSLDAASSQILIVTGPNMAGKSTFIRQAALLVAMAQAGSFVPARSLRLGFVDKIFARVGASDDIARGRSTFMVEMVETARVLRTATERSLVVLDEVGRGTSTYDGVSIAWAVTEHLHEAPGLGCRTLFATHYHELCAISGELPRVKNVSVAVREWGDEITFLYRIVKGGADRSYGIHVARLAGVPAAVIERAREILTLLESRGQTPADKPIKGRKRAKVEQLALFLPDGPLPGEPSKVEEALKEVRIENLTPLQALVTLEELKRLLEP
jgi:DNA mismatch repair protein MutS